MNRKYFVFIVVFVLFLVGCVAQSEPSETVEPVGIDAQLAQIVAHYNLEPFPAPPEQDEALVRLGQALFFDKELSGNRDVSCATCHHPLTNTGDGLSFSIGVGGDGLGPARELGYDRELIPRNAPDVFNRGHQEWVSMFWDSRVTGTVETGFLSPAGSFLPDGLNNVLAAQAMFPVTSDAEMRGVRGDTDVFGEKNELAYYTGDDFTGIWAALMRRIMKYDAYRTFFAEAYPGTPLDEMGFEFAANAIAAYEIDSFSFTDSPWDRYLAGETGALSNEAKEGAILFYGEAGCVACHSGNLLTDQKHHNIATPQLGPGKGDEAPFDFGRGRETENDEDKFCFRTPALRNVALTGPWMHNGAYHSLEDVVRHHLDPQGSLRNYDISQLHPDLQVTVMTGEEFYAEMFETIDPLVETAKTFDDAQVSQIVAFLNALTSPSALDLRATVPRSIPSGLPLGD